MNRLVVHNLIVFILILFYRFDVINMSSTINSKEKTNEKELDVNTVTVRDNLQLENITISTVNNNNNSIPINKKISLLNVIIKKLSNNLFEQTNKIVSDDHFTKMLNESQCRFKRKIINSTPNEEIFLSDEQSLTKQLKAELNDLHKQVLTLKDLQTEKKLKSETSKILHSNLREIINNTQLIGATNNFMDYVINNTEKLLEFTTGNNTLANDVKTLHFLYNYPENKTTELNPSEKSQRTSDDDYSEERNPRHKFQRLNDYPDEVIQISGKGLINNTPEEINSRIRDETERLNPGIKPRLSEDNFDANLYKLLFSYLSRDPKFTKGLNLDNFPQPTSNFGTTTSSNNDIPAQNNNDIREKIFDFQSDIDNLNKDYSGLKNMFQKKQPPTIKQNHDLFLQQQINDLKAKIKNLNQQSDQEEIPYPRIKSLENEIFRLHGIIDDLSSKTTTSNTIPENRESYDSDEETYSKYPETRFPGNNLPFNIKPETLSEKIFGAITTKIIRKVAIVLKIIFGVLFGINLDDTNNYYPGAGSGYGSGGIIGSVFKNLGLIGLIPTVLIKFLDVFLTIVRRSTFLRTFLIPAGVLLIVNGLVIFLIWSLNQQDCTNCLHNNIVDNNNNYNSQGYDVPSRPTSYYNPSQAAGTGYY